MKTEIKIFIDSYENTKYFSGKLTGNRDGFTRITRKCEVHGNTDGIKTASVKIKNKIVGVISYGGDDFTIEIVN